MKLSLGITSRHQEPWSRVTDRVKSLLIYRVLIYLGKGPHKGLVVLHAASGVYEDDVEAVLAAVVDGHARDVRSVLTITLCTRYK